MYKNVSAIKYFWSTFSEYVNSFEKHCTIRTFELEILFHSKFELWYKMSFPSVDIWDTKHKQTPKKVNFNITFKHGWVSSIDWSLEFDTPLNSSTNTRPFSTVSRLLAPHLTNLTQTICNQCLFWIVIYKWKWIIQMNPMTLTWPLRRIWARLNFSRCLTLGFRSIFFLLGVSPLFLDIFSQNTWCEYDNTVRNIV